MDNGRHFKDRLFEQFARIGKALGSRRRLELLDVLAQGPRSVEQLAQETGMPIANASQHLQVLRRARLVETRQEGTYVYYELADEDVFTLWKSMREVGAARLAEVDHIVQDFLGSRRSLDAVPIPQLQERLRRGDVIVLDVRPHEEYRSGHIPGALSVPVADIDAVLADLPNDKEIVAYCRGPYCVFADEAVEVLRRHGRAARRLDVGYPDWKAAGLPVSNDAPGDLKIDPTALQERLVAGLPTTILDVRPASEREEWYIPGSIHVKAYEALKTGGLGPIEPIQLPDDQLIVAVCGAGKTSLTAAKLLRERGKNAVSLAGGMKAWSIAHNTAEVALNGTSAEVVQLRRTGKGCLSYMAASDGEAIVVDASLPPEVYLELARKRGWNITHVIDTHVHADHFSRSRLLAERAGAELHLPETERVNYQVSPVRDGDVFRIGSAHLRAIHTPGHTEESTTYLLDEAVLFTGDTLFIDGVGRPDLEAGKAEARSRAEILYDSLRHLFAETPAEATVLPGHTSRPIDFDGRPVAATLREMRDRLEVLSLPKDRFAQHLLKGIPPIPANYQRLVALNESGETEVDHLLDLEAGANRCAVV